MSTRRFFSFPHPVDETSARLVAAGVVAQAVAYLVLRETWLLVPLAYGFAARVTTGPRFSPLGLLVTRVLSPRIPGEHRMVPGPPKRFAQGLGLVFSGGALVATAAGSATVAVVLISGLLVAASLEAGLGLCLGCVMFGWLIRLGVVPQSICAECGDIRAHLAARAAVAERVR